MAMRPGRRHVPTRVPVVKDKQNAKYNTPIFRPAILAIVMLSSKLMPRRDHVGRQEDVRGLSRDGDQDSVHAASEEIQAPAFDPRVQGVKIENTATSKSCDVAFLVDFRWPHAAAVTE